jgi:hypothetical protein
MQKIKWLKVNIVNALQGILVFFLDNTCKDEMKVQVSFI